MKAAKAQQQQQQQEEGQQEQQQAEGSAEGFASRMREQLAAKRRALGKETAEGGQGLHGPEAGGTDKEGGEDSEDGGGSESDGGEGARKRQRVGPTGKHAAAVVAPSKQIKVADSELLTDWERKRQASQAG